MTNNSAAQNWKEAFAALFSKTGLSLAAVFTATTLLDQTLSDLVQSELMNPKGTSGLIWVYGILSFITGILGPVAVSFLALCAWRLPSQNIKDAAGAHLSYLIKEEIRVLGKSIVWSLLLIIPGLIRFFLSAFVPYVVMLDQKYQLGQVDALNTSSQFVKKVWGRLLGLFVVFGVLIPLLMTAFDEWRPLLRQPATGMMLLFVELTLLVIFQWLILKTWERAHEPHV